MAAPSEEEDAASDAANWGASIDPSWLGDVALPDDGIWAQHVPALEAFLVVCRQWRVVAGMSGAAYIGLDYTAAKAGLKLAGIEVSPETWADLRDIEAGALEALNGRRA